MRRLKLFIACSLDNYIARADHSIDWLFEGTENEDYGYSSFYDSIDTTVMGRNTFDTIITFGNWPYPSKTNYVFTHNPTLFADHSVQFLTVDAVKWVENLKNQTGKDIWLVGGGELISTLYNADLIDEYILSIHPVVLGEGIPLFSHLKKEQNLRLKETKSYADGLVQIHLEKPISPP